MANAPQYYSLLQLQELLRDLINACPMSRDVWIVAELSDVAERGGHCYMDLLQKDPSTGASVARARATIWSNVWRRLKVDFFQSTGQQFASGLQVMVRVTAGYHPVYGMSLNITAVNPNFTLGERERRRREILERLKREGIMTMNREIGFPRPCLRVAVISAAGAAGYGDFKDQLILNERRVRFHVGLFPAVMQGQQVPASITEALERIAEEQDQWDCVCIIRGGGASTDLDGFDNYQLAANVAQFPLPVIVGIGHERDITVLDYVAGQRVKTPTAAAEFLLDMAYGELDGLRDMATRLAQAVSEQLGGAKQQLAYISGQLPTAPLQAIQRAELRLTRATSALSHISANRIQPMGARLDRMADALRTAALNSIERQRIILKSKEELLNALSPQAVLSRGYSITRLNGKALTDAAELKPGDVLTTTLFKGEITSTTNSNQ